MTIEITYTNAAYETVAKEVATHAVIVEYSDSRDIINTTYADITGTPPLEPGEEIVGVATGEDYVEPQGAQS